MSCRANAEPVTGVDPVCRFEATATRQAHLSATLRALHQAILTSFLDTGAPPRKPWLGDQANRLGLPVAEALAELAATDLVHIDGAGDVSVAYPFCGTPTSHRVEPVSGPPVWAMCAIDALGIPQMADCGAVITSIDPLTGDPVRVEITNRTWTWNPAGAVVLMARTGAGGSSSCSTCPYINFHTEPATAVAYLQEHPELAGRILDQPAARTVACLTFGPLLCPPSSPKARGPAHGYLAPTH